MLICGTKKAGIILKILDDENQMQRGPELAGEIGRRLCDQLGIIRKIDRRDHFFDFHYLPHSHLRS